MRDEDYDMAQRNPDYNGGIHTAVNAWFADSAAAKARYGPIASWDTSGITGMHMLFYYRLDFNEDISRWNVSNVVSMRRMFDGAASFNGDLSRWDVSNVVYMGSMFDGATSFNGNLSSWDVSNVEDMRSMFQGATSFDRQLDGAWSASAANNGWMFHNSPGTIAGRRKDANGSVPR